MGFFVNLGSLLSRKGTTYHGSARSKPLQELLDTTTNEENYLGNWARQMSGSALTDAEREANAFNAQQAQLAFDRQMAARSTAFQAQVQDMKAAGLNPMMAASGSGSAVPSAGGASSVSPGSSPLNLGSLLSAVSGLQVNSAQAALMRAEAEKAKADTEKVRTETGYFKLVSGLRAEGEAKLNALTDARINEINQSIEESKSRVFKNASESEAALQRALLDKANAQNIEYMQPFLAAKASAETDVAILDAAYKQGLLDSGAIAAAVRASNASASEAEVRAEVESIEKELKAKESAMTPDFVNGSIGQKIIGGIRIISKSILGK